MSKNMGKEKEEMRGLFELTMAQKWKEVVEIYNKDPNAHRSKLTKSDETALHIAISSYHSKSPKATDHANYIEQMMRIMEGARSLLEVLEMANMKGDTPLHLAAAVNSAAICKRIAEKNRELISKRNVRGETPLFVAAHHGNLKAFHSLHDEYYAYKRDQQSEIRDNPLRRTDDGDTALHSAISGENFKLAYLIISKYPSLMDSVNVNGESPLHVLAKKPNVFESSSHLQLYDSIIFKCVFVDELDQQQECDSKATQNGHFSKQNFPENYMTCGAIFSHLWNLIFLIIPAFESSNKDSGDSKDEKNPANRKNKPAGFESSDTKDEENPANPENKLADERRNSNRGGFFPANYATSILLIKFAMKIILVILGIGFKKIKQIKLKKERYCHAMEVMNKLINHESRYKSIFDSNGERPDKNLETPLFDDILAGPNKPPEKQEESPKLLVSKATPLLLAAKMGILEMVKRIICKFPVAIQDHDSEGKNVLMLAAEYRQTSVFDYLLNKLNLPEYMFHHLDNNKNGILHLTAKLGNADPWRIPGAALQMQWEFKWYKHVKESVSQYNLTHNNSESMTPRMVFSKTHEDLVQKANEWLIKTSESCSLVAALIAGVAFATSATVPGGLHQEKGYPILKDYNAFDVFAIASLVALCLSVTALVFFLTIVTSRCQERDFKSNLPRILLMGMSSLFSAIAAMLLSFCAGHTFIMRVKLRLAAVPIYAFAVIPIVIFAKGQLPLYFDLLWAAYRKVPLRNYKVFYQ